MEENEIRETWENVQNMIDEYCKHIDEVPLMYGDRIFTTPPILRDSIWITFDMGKVDNRTELSKLMNRIYCEVKE